VVLVLVIVGLLYCRRRRRNAGLTGPQEAIVPLPPTVQSSSLRRAPEKDSDRHSGHTIHVFAKTDRSPDGSPTEADGPAETPLEDSASTFFSHSIDEGHESLGGFQPVLISRHPSNAAGAEDGTSTAPDASSPTTDGSAAPPSRTAPDCGAVSSTSIYARATSLTNESRHVRAAASEVSSSLSFRTSSQPRPLPVPPSQNFRNDFWKLVEVDGEDNKDSTPLPKYDQIIPKKPEEQNRDAPP